jgi:hypothetical protein
LGDISFDFIGKMKSEKVENLMAAYLQHPNHQVWVNEIRAEVQHMLQPFFDPRWKYIGNTESEIENYRQIEQFLTAERVQALTANINVETGSCLDLNKVIDNINDQDTIKSIQNLLKTRLIVLTIMHRKSIFFKTIPNVADLAIFVAIHPERLIQGFLDALYYIKIGLRVRNGQLYAINANSRNDATVRSFYRTFLCIRGSLTILSDRKKMKYDSFEREKLLPEEQAWLAYMDKNNIFV